jgi:hypothetical protein
MRWKVKRKRNSKFTEFKKKKLVDETRLGSFPWALA